MVPACSNGHHGDVVVVVEDDDDIRSSLKFVLDYANYRVLTAADGAEALKLLDGLNDSPCLVLLDLMMPVMDGWDLCDEMRGDKRWRDIPIYVLSGVSNIGEETRQLDVDGYLKKPFGVGDVVDIASRYCCVAD